MLFVYDSEKKELTRQKTGVSIRAAAKALHTTEYKLRLVIDVFNLHGEAGVRKMQHGGGRPNKLLNITQPQIVLITSYAHLQKVATKTLGERVAIYNDEWKEQGCNLTKKDLKKFYDGAKITLQRFTTELGPPRPDERKMRAQKANIEYAQKAIMYWRGKGYDVIQVDEAIFNKSDCNNYAWSIEGNPLLWDWKAKRALLYVAVCAFISATRGKIFVDCKYDSYKTDSIIRVLG